MRSLILSHLHVRGRCCLIRQVSPAAWRPRLSSFLYRQHSETAVSKASATRQTFDSVFDGKSSIVASRFRL